MAEALKRVRYQTIELDGRHRTGAGVGVFLSVHFVDQLRFT